MYWKFEIYFKSLYSNNLRVVLKDYDKEIYSWHEAWTNCVDDAINNLSRGEVVHSIVSINDIVRCNK